MRFIEKLLASGISNVLPLVVNYIGKNFNMFLFTH